MKNLKKVIIIIIFVIIIIMVLLVLALLKNNKKERETKYRSYANGADQVIIDTKLKEVTEPTYYYTVYDCMVNYVKAVITELEEIREEDYIPGGEMNFFEMNGIKTQEEKNQYIYNLLDNKYIEENNITINSVNKYLNKEKLNINFNIEKMYERLLGRVYQYIVYINTKENVKLCFLISLDTQNLTYMIRPVQYIEYDELKMEDFYEEIEEIKENSNNIYEYNRISKEEMAKKYFYKFKDNIISNPSYIYNRFNKEYRSARFRDFNEFSKYIADDKENLLNISLSKYLVNVYDDYTEYVCKDQNDNTYIFKTYAVMNYELMLDTYTIKTDKFLNEYEQANEEKKVQMNIDKFIQMINRHDYKTSYNCLSQGFKNNYFNTQEQFENYAKNIFFTYNKFNFKNITENGNNLYTCVLDIEDATGKESEVRTINIIMKLNDNLDFEMSFSV